MQGNEEAFDGIREIIKKKQGFFCLDHNRSCLDQRTRDLQAYIETWDIQDKHGWYEQKTKEGIRNFNTT